MFVLSTSLDKPAGFLLGQVGSGTTNVLSYLPVIDLLFICHLIIHLFGNIFIISQTGKILKSTLIPTFVAFATDPIYMNKQI